VTVSELDVVVPPRYCDAQGMVHASRYHEFLEDAFLRWLVDVVLPYDDLRRRGGDLVVGTSTIRYHRPARLGDRLTIRSEATNCTTSTETVAFAVNRDNSSLAEASITYIAVHAGESAPLPSELVPRPGTS
jgi:YbgC/YbaW family acyl-CoA thioester hydrolase